MSVSSLRLRPYLAVAGLLLILTVPALDAQIAGVEISGWVKDPQGEPIAGAEVTVSTLGPSTLRFTRKTDAKGRYDLELFEKAPGYSIVVTKEGFQPERRDLLAGLEQTELRGRVEEDFTLYLLGEDRPEPQGGDFVLLSRPHGGSRLYTKGSKAYEAGELEEARRHWEKLRKLDPDFTAAHEGLALVYHRLGLHAEAAETAERVLEDEPMHLDALRIRYVAYRELGDRERAREALAHLVEVDAGGRMAPVFFNEGVSAVTAGELDDAVAMFEAAIRFDSRFVEARDALAKVYFEKDLHAAAIGAAEEVLSERPGDLELLRIRHRSYEALGDREGTRRALADLIEHDPGERTATLLYNEGVIAFNAGDHDTARGLFEQALEMAPGHHEARLGLGTVHLDQNRPQAALEAAEEILAKSPGHSGARRLAERARARLGS